MSSPSLPALRQLDRLDKFSSKFDDRLSNALYGDEYQQCVPELQGDDLVWLVEYLDKVRHRFAFVDSPLKPGRLSTTSIIVVLLSANAYASSEACAARVGNSQCRICFRIPF